MNYNKVIVPRKNSQQWRCYCKKSNLDNSKQKMFTNQLQNSSTSNLSNKREFTKLNNEFVNSKSKSSLSDGLHTRPISKVSFQSNANFIPIEITGEECNRDNDVEFIPKNPNLTERRNWYEHSKKFLSSTSSTSVSTQTLLSKDREHFLENLQADKIEDLKKFRLDNANECFSNHNIRPNLAEHDHICEFSYRVNERKLLEPVKMKNNKLICNICGKVNTMPIEKNIVPLTCNEKKHKVILELKYEDKEKTKIRKLLNKSKPSNSLALIYQKTY